MWAIWLIGFLIFFSQGGSRYECHCSKEDDCFVQTVQTPWGNYDTVFHLSFWVQYFPRPSYRNRSFDRSSVGFCQSYMKMQWTISLHSLSFSLSCLKKCCIVLNTTAYINNVNNISWVLVSVFLVCVCRYLYTYLQLMPTVIVHLLRKWYIIHPWIPRN